MFSRHSLQLISKCTLFFLIAILELNCADGNEHDAKTIIRNVHVLSMLDSNILLAQDIEILDGIITKISDHQEVHAYAAGVQVVEGEGRFVMPSLADAHVHLPQNRSEQILQESLNILLCHGVTWVRNMAGTPFQLEFITSRSELCPQIHEGSPIIRGDKFTSLPGLKDSLHHYYREGYDFYKVHRFLSKEQFAAIAQVGSKNRIPLAGHVPHSVNIIDMIQTSTVKTIDHLDGFFPYLASVSELPTNESLGVYNEDLAPEVDLHLLPELSRQLVHHNVAIVPTLFFVQMWYDFERCKPGIYRNTVYLRPGFMTKWNGLLQMVRSRIRHDVQLGREILTIRDQIVRQLFHANVRILLGSGAYEVDMIPGFSLVDELLSIEKAGLSPFEALKTCTVNISDHFGLERGRVAIGKPADLILIKENPLHNLETLREIQGLFNNGRWFSKAMLDQLLLEAKIDD